MEPKNETKKVAEVFHSVSQKHINYALELANSELSQARERALQSLLYDTESDKKHQLKAMECYHSYNGMMRVLDALRLMP